MSRIYILPEDVNRAGRPSPKPFRKVVRWLTTVVDTAYRTWAGDFDQVTAIETYGIPSADQEESLFYIFNTLDSPSTRVKDLAGSRYAHNALVDVLDDRVSGIKTRLYPYQKRSVASMLQREEAPARSQDARKPAYVDLQGEEFYMDVYEGGVFQHSHLYVEPRGGILAETMGYGKTLVCLTLVLATRGFYPSVPETRLERPQHKMEPKTSSLLSMAARSLRHHGVPWKAQFHALAQQGLHYTRCLEETKKYLREFGEPIFHPTTPGRKASRRESERTLRLCNGTLVIVPPNLIVQWQHEIEKHTEPGALDLLVIDMTTKEIPHWRQLMEYDMILISKNRLDQEYRDDDLNQGKRLKGSERISSQLCELRWLRVICDEGHSFASSTSRTRTMAMLDKLSIERRWIVSGTPSSSLIGVDVNLAADDTHTGRRRNSLSKALEQKRIPDSAKKEEHDMDRLRLIVVNFLKVQPWANQKGADQANWKKYLSPFSASGQRRCAPGLRPLLQSLMVRHRIRDIDVDVTLPPLHNDTVYLESSYYDKLALNLFILVLTANAVTSERTDEDYMHHPKNRKNLDLLISNLRQSTFHWVGFTPGHVEETIKACNTYFDKHLDDISDEDGVLLTQAVLFAQRVLGDLGWQAFAKLHEIGVYTDQFPSHAAEAWSMDGQRSKPLLLGTVQAREAQKYIRSHMHEEDPASGLIGAGMRAMHDARKRADDESEKNKKANNGTAHVQPPGVSDEPKVRPSLPRLQTSASPKTPSPRKRSHSALLTPQMTFSSTALAATQITGFTSAKLTYICSSIMALPPGTKSLIFYDSNNVAFWLAEALELLGIQFLIYSNTLPPSTRAKYLSMFNNEPKWQVLLMDLKQASTGLHVASASRVWIVTPIWRREVEAQAIKRAHRIGQVNEVRVETLVLKGTIEEEMWQRRKGMTEVERQALGSTAGGGPQNIGSGGWLEDGGVIDIIKRARFLNIGPDESGDGLESCCRLEQPVPLFRQPDVADVDDGGQESGQDAARTKKKRKVKGVSFAAEPLTPPESASGHQSIFGGFREAGSGAKKNVGFVGEAPVDL